MLCRRAEPFAANGADPLATSGSVPFADKRPGGVCHPHREASRPGSVSAIPFLRLTGPCRLAGLRLMAKGPGGLLANAPDRLVSQRPRPVCRTPDRAVCRKRIGRELKIFQPTIDNDRHGAANDPPTIRQRSGCSRRRFAGPGSDGYGARSGSDVAVSPTRMSRLPHLPSPSR